MMPLLNNSRPSPFGWLCMVFVLAVVVRIAAATYWHQAAQTNGELFRVGDSHSYWTLAENIAHGRPYQYGSENASIFRAPLYPLLLSPITQVADPSTAVYIARIVGCLFGAITVLLVAIAAGKLAGPKAALAAGILAAFYPSGIGMSIMVLSEAISMPLMLGHIILWGAAWQEDSTKSTLAFSVGAGILAGLSILARPSWLLFVPFSLAFGLLLGPNRRQHLQIFCFSLLGLCITMSPWWIRNATITGKFVPTTLQVGPSLYDGLHEGATGSSDEGMDFMKVILTEQLAIDSQMAASDLESTLEWRLNQRALSKAINWAADSPFQVLELAVAKFRRTWSLWPDGGEISSNTIRVALTVGSFSILLLAIAGSFFLREHWDWQIGLYWLPCLYFTLLHMVFVGSIRYREPAMVVLCILAGCAIARILGKSFCGIGSSEAQNKGTYKVAPDASKKL